MKIGTKDHTVDLVRYASVETPSILVNAGVQVGIAISDPSNPRNLRWEAGLANYAGLSYDQGRIIFYSLLQNDAVQMHSIILKKRIESDSPLHVAIAAITSVPASILGLPNGTGTIQVGSLANFVVFNGDPLQFGPTVQMIAVGEYVECQPQQY